MPVGGSSYSSRPAPVLDQRAQPPGTTANADGSYSEGNGGWPYFQTTGPPPAPTRTNRRRPIMRSSRTRRTPRRPSLDAQTQGIYGF